MTSERAQAYGRLMRRLRSADAAGLLPHEEDRIREAADALLFCSNDWSDEQTLEELGEAVRLVEGLAEEGRWQDAHAQLVLRELRACGPLAAV